MHDCTFNREHVPLCSSFSLFEKLYVLKIFVISLFTKSTFFTAQNYATNEVRTQLHLRPNILRASLNRWSLSHQGNILTNLPLPGTSQDSESTATISELSRQTFLSKNKICKQITFLLTVLGLMKVADVRV